MRTLPILAITLVLISICSFSCDKEEKEPELPPITQSGANTFGCLVNGEVWLPKKGMITRPPFGASNNQYEDKRWIIFGANNNGGVGISICQDSINNGKSTFKKESLENCSSASYSDVKEYSSIFHTDGDFYNGEVIITRYDIKERIIAGAFWFDAINSDGKKVQIRDGRFDLKFTNYQP